MLLHVLLPSSRYSTSTMVRKIATGSLSPDSTSSVALTRGRRRRPLACSRKNTAAASVEATTAPASSASGQLMPRVSTAAGAVSAAVRRTPSVDKRTGRAEHVAEGLEAGAQAAVEQDQAERDRAHGIGQSPRRRRRCRPGRIRRPACRPPGRRAATGRRSAARPGSTGCRTAPAASPAAAKD